MILVWVRTQGLTMSLSVGCEVAVHGGRISSLGGATETDYCRNAELLYSCYCPHCS